MKTKFIRLLGVLLLISGCSNTTTSSEQPSLPSYTIKVIDIDGQELSCKNIEYNENSSVFEDLKANFNVNYTMDSYGPYLSSIDGSIVDSNYYLAIYQNNEPASTGVDGLTVKENDVFEFKVECWNTISSGYGTLDEYDLLVDKVIYGYMKTLDLSTSSTFMDSSFWDLMTIKVAKDNYYDSSIFNFDDISNATKQEIESYDINNLKDSNLYKYYLYSKALNKDLSALKTYAASYIETLSDEYNDYVSPFIVAASYGLNITSSKIDTLVNKEISTNLMWGPDIPVWQYTTSKLYKNDIDNSTLNLCVEKLDYENSCSTSLVLQAFAAANENIRDSKYELNGKDLIEVLFDNYYNESTNILEYTKGELNTFSANQTIASLMAYKVCRDTGKAINIYG